MIAERTARRIGTAGEEDLATIPGQKKGEWSDELGYQRLEKVLVVEDDEDLNRALAMRLQLSGLGVTCAYDGAEALSKFRDAEPDVVVLDLCLPRMDGAKFLHVLRTTPDLLEVPIVVVTGKADSALEGKVSRWGVERLLRKPVSLRRITREVIDILEGY